MSDAPTPRGNTRSGWAATLVVAVPLLVAFEGLARTAWHDRIDPRGVNTVCYGHIEDVQLGDSYTKIECEEMLAKDLPRYEAMVRKCIKVEMPPRRHAAVLSFTYNLGGGALCKSSVARRLNAGDVRGGCDAMLAYNKSTGVVRKGLVRRREAERRLCLMDN